jgi:DNA-binding CsgD family transcriptional regulator/tetratricopeptide (TPR) repeat protein
VSEKSIWLAPRITTHDFIGRSEELSTLERQLDDIDNGGHIVLISGEAGIGKSRIATEIVARAQRKGSRCFDVRCYESDRAYPFAPLRELLVDRSSERPFKEFDSQTGPIVAPDKLRLFTSLAHSILDPSGSQPIVLLAEDLHWSDDATLEFLLFLARRALREPFLMLATYRSDDRTAGLDQFLDNVHRERLASELRLVQLSRNDVGQMIRAILGPERHPRAGLVRKVHELTDGNPLFVEEVLALLSAGGRLGQTDQGTDVTSEDWLSIPQGLTGTVRSRTADLSAAAKTILDAAAVIGQRFDFSVLRDLTELEESILIPLLKELISNGLVVEESTERFAFRHALTRRAIYGDLLARERISLHRRVAEILIQLDEDERDRRVGELAYHSFNAQHWPQALEFSSRAGDHARAFYAPFAAIEQYDQAIQSAQCLGRSPSIALHRNRGLAHETVGNFDAARADFESSLRLGEVTGNRTATWQALLDLGLLWSSRDHEQGRHYLQRALDLARSVNDKASLAQSLNRMGNWIANAEDPEAALLNHQEALAIFEELGDRHGIAATLDLIGAASALGGRPRYSLKIAEQAIEQFQSLGDLHGLTSSLAMMGGVIGSPEMETWAPPGTMTEAIRASDEALRLAREIDWRSGESFTSALAGSCHGRGGHFSLALDLLNEALAIAKEIGHQEWSIQSLWGLGQLHSDFFALEAAQQYLEQALDLSRAIQSPLWVTLVTGGLASLLIQVGDLSAAEALLIDAYLAVTALRTQGQRWLACAAAELALARNAPDEALAIVGRLYATCAEPSDETQIPRLALIKAHALALLGDWTQAEKLLRETQATAQAHGSLPILLRAQIGLVTLLQDTNNEQDLAVEVETTHQLIDELVFNAPVNQLCDGLLNTKTTLPKSPSVLRRRLRSPTQGALSAREREVAALVALGHSNREIAAEHFIGERTVEAHITNILHKLGFRSRVQIATYIGERNETTSAT